MNVIDAAFATVHDYPGGSESLAPRMDMSAAVLRNKVNPHNDRNHLTMAEAMRMQALTGDHRVAQVMAAELGYLLVSTTTPAEPTDNIMGGLLDTAASSGTLAQTIRTALADGVISEREMRAIETAGLANQRIIVNLVARLAAMAATRPEAMA